MEDRRLLATLTVNSLADNTNADTELTLREAIALVNSVGNPMDALGRNLTPQEDGLVNDMTDPFGTLDTIQFENFLSGGTITMSESEFFIVEDLIINGLGAGFLTIDANLGSRIFRVDDFEGGPIDVTIQGLTLTGGSVASDGGAILSLENLTISNSEITGNEAMNGGAIHHSFGNLTISNSVLSNNSASVEGGGIYNDDTSLTVTGSQLANNSARFGGGIENNGGTVSISNSSFTGNIVMGSGGLGGAVENFGGSMTIIDSEFMLNQAVQGGAIINSGTLSVTRGTFDQNSTTSAGGAIANSPAGTINISESTFSDNSTLAFGGAIINDGTLTLTSSRLIGNSADTLGGGIDNSGMLTVVNSTLADNTADFGGGIYHITNLLSIQNSTISENLAPIDGGGIYLDGDAVIENSTISHNSTNGMGGGLLNNSLCTLTLTNSTLTMNSATGGGGGIEAAGTEIVANTIVAGNSAGGSNDVNGMIDSGSNNIIGAMDITTVLDPVLRPNGGITQTHALVAGSPAIDAGDNMFAAAFTNDQRGDPFVRIFNGTVDIGSYEAQTIVVPNPDNTGDESDGDYSDGNVTLREAIELANGSVGAETIDATGLTGTVTLTGGELSITDPLTINGPGSSQLTIDGDGATRIFNVDDGFNTEISVTISDLTLTNGSTDASGGGILNFENLNLIDIELTGNTADSGGAIANLGTLGIEDGMLSQNSAIRSGGGIMSDGDATLMNTDLSNNTANDDGGGIMSTGGTLSLMGGTLNRNMAINGDGGGIHNTGNASLTGTTLTGNQANQDGGGIFNDGLLMVAAGSMLSENSAKFGGAISSFSDLSISASTITRNSAQTDGGGVNSSGNLDVSDSTFSFNSTESGGGIFNEGTATITGSQFIQNGASMSGGGIANFAESLTVENSIFSENTANDVMGGGGGVFNMGNLMLIGSTLSGNSASFGGGVDNKGMVTVMGSTLSGNTAEGVGGAIDNDGGTARVMGSMLMSNLAKDSGGGIINSDGDVMLEDTMLMQNTAMSDGGGIENFGTLTIMGSTLSGNMAMGATEGTGFGGAIDNFRGTTTIMNSTISQNSARAGAGIDENEGTLTLMDTMVMNNSATLFGGGVELFESTATITGGSISNNTAGFDGGGIENFFSTLTVENVMIEGNSAAGLGGGVDNFAGTLVLRRATIQHNTSVTGGGIYNNQDMTLIDSTIAENSANIGGGVYNVDVLRILNSTLSRNSANRGGGGIFNAGVSEVVSTTIFGNRADADGDGTGEGGGIWTGRSDDTLSDTVGTILFNTIVAGNLRGSGSFADDIANQDVDPISNNNLIGDPNSAGGLTQDPADADGDGFRNIVGDGAGNVLDADTFLDTTLRNNGGPTKTHALLPDGVAINGGRDVDPPVIVGPPPTQPLVKEGRGKKMPLPGTGGPPSPPPMDRNPDGPPDLDNPPFDQRGEFFYRITGGAIDIGAFEFQFEITMAVGSGGETEAQVLFYTDVFPSRPFVERKPYSVMDPDPNSTTDRPQIFEGAVRVALADITGDGFNEIITAAGPGGGPHVIVYDGRTFEVISSFFAYDSGFVGGVFVAAGDLNGDGMADIVTGADAGGGPHVRAFSGANGDVLFNFFAYDPGFRGGVRVAAGDVNDDQRADIITGAGPGGGPHVRVFNGADPAAAVSGRDIDSFFAFTADYTGGIFVAANNTPGAVSQIVVSTGTAFLTGARVALITRPGGNDPAEFTTFELPTSAGARVAVLDFNGDGIDDILAGSGPGVSTLLQLFRGDPGDPPFDEGEPFGPTIVNVFPFGQLYQAGIFVAGTNGPT